MRNSFLVLGLLFANSIFAQKIVLSEASKVNENNDKRLYRIESTSNSIKLGTIEIVGDLDNDVAAFNAFYQKARTVGANSYIYSVEKDLNNEDIRSNVKIISLYFTQNLPEKYNTYYILNSGKSQNVVVSGKKVEIPSKSFIQDDIKTDESNYISTRKFLGSRINLYYKSSQPEQYFQVISGGVKSDQTGVGGLVLKTGDLIMLERSFANFLTLFYKRVTL